MINITSIQSGCSGFQRFRLTFVNAILLWERPIPAAILAAIIFFGFGMLGKVPSWGVSGFAYFNYLADAFLHGQLNLRLIPVEHLDLSFYQGKYYLYWSPLPAILMMPLVALFGVGVSDCLQSILFSGAIIGLTAELLCQIDRIGWVHLIPMQRALLVAFITLGTALTPLPGGGGVWHLSTIEAIAFTLLVYLISFTSHGKQAFFFTGLAVAAVLTTRMSMVFSAIFPAWYLLRTHWNQGLRRMAVNCLLGILPGVASFGLLAAYNSARFGNPLENGVSYHMMSDVFVPLFKQYGFMNPHFIPGNFYYTYIAHPLVIYLILHSGAVWGGSLFLMSPLFFAVFPALWQERGRVDTWMLLAAILLGNIRY